MLLNKKLNKMTIKEKNDINTYLIEAINMKNQLNSCNEEITNMILVNIVFKGITTKLQNDDLRYYLYVIIHI